MAEAEYLIVRGDAWTVLSRTAYRDCTALRLAGAGTANAGVARTLLVPFDRPRSVARCAALRPVRPRRWLHALRTLAAGVTPHGALARASQSGIELIAYQLEPALSMLRHGRTRLLVADGVGLGKTVQAGLILNELAFAEDTFRGLVVCPAGLRAQWVAELRAHFRLDSTCADASWLARSQRELPREVNPWALPGLFIASFDFVKRPEVLRPLEDVTWDALVVDEAHLASTGTNRRSAVEALALRSRRIVLLSATPEAGDADQFDALCRLGGGDPITVFRRRRADVAPHRPRRTLFFAVRLSHAERRMHRLLGTYTARVAVEASARGDAAARLAAVVLRKRALSSAGSLAVSVRRRLDLLTRAGAAADCRQLPLPLDGETVADEEPDEVLGTPGLMDAAAERQALLEVAEAADLASRSESKARFLARLIARARQAVIVFTEYRDTLVRLDSMLRRAGHRPALLHGGMRASDRARVQHAFNDCGGILLATDAASEGLNLHQRCRTVLHYELPWSPVRLEQRTGRVDRYGQRSAVHELLLVANHTAERVVLAPLARRALAARRSDGEADRYVTRLTESRVSRAILDDEPLHALLADAVDATAQRGAVATPVAGLHAEAAIEADRLRAQRETSRGRPPRPDPSRARPARPVVTCVRARRGMRGATAVFVYALALRDGNGRVADRAVTCLEVPRREAGMPRRAIEARRAARDCLDRVAADVALAIDAAVAERLGGVRAVRDGAVAAAARRERLLAGQWESAARAMVQASLFDGRSVRAHRVRREASEALLDESRRRLAALGRSRGLVAEVELRAVLLVS